MLMFSTGKSVPSCEAADNPGTGDRSVADGDNVLEFGFEDTVSISPVHILPYRIECEYL